MRNSCFDCCRKHLAQALIISHELAWYAGNPKDDHFWVLIGHLAEAGDQIQVESQFIADQIRTQRLMLMKDGPGAARRLDINMLIRLVCESMPPTQPSVLGLEPTDDENPSDPVA
jgi:hypothetical protein